MALTDNDVLHCPCGHDQPVVIARSLNASRYPHVRDDVMQRRLHRFVCTACQRVLVADSECFWFDFHRKEFIGVFPHARRARPDECEPIVAATFERTMKENAAEFVRSYARGFYTRTCFGLEELREKLVIHEAGLDDFLVEVLKSELLASHPELLARGVVTVRLDSFLDDGSLLLIPEAHDGTLAGDPAVGIGARREIYDAFVPHRDALLRERGAIHGGTHISFRRIVDAI